MSSRPVGAVDSFWVLSSTQGLPIPLIGATTYAIIDGEIISYTGFHPTLPLLQNVRRGELNSIPTAHSTGTVIGPQIAQGERNLAMLKLELWSGNFQIQLSGLKLNRTLPAGLNGEDSDVDVVTIYRSATPDGVFRDPDTGFNLSDTSWANRFGVPPDRRPHDHPHRRPDAGPPGYALIPSTRPTTWPSTSPSARSSLISR